MPDWCFPVKVAPRHRFSHLEISISVGILLNKRPVALMGRDAVYLIIQSPVDCCGGWGDVGGRKVGQQKFRSFRGSRKPGWPLHLHRQPFQHEQAESCPGGFLESGGEDSQVRTLHKVAVIAVSQGKDPHAAPACLGGTSVK